MGFFYKKCEVCGNKINKFKAINLYGFASEIECKNCKTEYVKKENFLYNFFYSAVLDIGVLMSLFFGFNFSIYIDDNFLHLNDGISFVFNMLICIVSSMIYCVFWDILYTYISLFIGKFKIKKDIKEQKSKTIFNKIIKFFSNKDRR